jgi:putative membrane protein
MIRNFTDHAANERTFLAWIRTGLAIAGLGVAIAKLALFVQGFSVWVGIALVVAASIIMAASTYRFIGLSKAIERRDVEQSAGITTELLLAVLLVLFVIVFGFLLWSASIQ